MKCKQTYSSSNGFATVLTLLGMLLVAVSLPVVTKLVQQNQDNRSNAAIESTYDIPKAGHEPECDKGETKCIDGLINTCNTSFRWTKTSQTCSDPKVTPGTPLCTKVTYGSWSACTNGKQTRTVTKTPTNCSGGVTILPSEQSCTIPTVTTIVTPIPVNPGGHEPECDKGESKCIDGFTNTCNSSYRWVKTNKTCSDPKVTPGTPLCTKVTYGSWSACTNGKQTRTVTKTPTNCSGGVTILPSEQSCVPICTSFTTGPWGACNKFADGTFQSRTITGVPAGCVGGNRPESRQSCTTCDSTNCSTCTNPGACRSSGCYWETQMKVCTSKANPTPVDTSHIPVCGSAEGACIVGVPDQVNRNSTTGESKWNCVIAGYYTKAGNFVNPRTTVNCSYTAKNVNCGSLDNPNSCRSSGCYWETQMKVCTSKDIPIAACDGASIGTQKCLDQLSSAICTKTGWQITNCNMLTQRCFSNKCENKKEYYEDHNPCTKSTYHLQTAYSSDACPKGYSCNRFTETCEAVDASAGKKGTGGNCSTDADCLSGYCVSDQNGNNSLSPQMYCKQISQEESIDELYMKTTETVGNILAITAGAIGAIEYGPQLYNYLKARLGSINLSSIPDRVASAFGKSGTEIIGVAEDGSRLVKIGGVTYVDTSMVSTDIYKKYGIDLTSEPGYEDILNLKRKIQDYSYSDGFFYDGNNITASLTGVNPQNNDAITDFLAVDSNAIAGKYNLPNPNNYSDMATFNSDFMSYASNNQTNIILDEFDKYPLKRSSSESIADFFNKDNEIGGVFTPEYPNNVFVVEDRLKDINVESIEVIGHEVVHLEQNKIYPDPFMMNSRGREYEAYLYSTYVGLIDQSKIPFNGIENALADQIVLSAPAITVEELLGLN